MINHIASAVRRADQVFSEQVGDKSTLDCGVAFFDVEYPHSAQNNVLREVWVEQSEAMPAAWAQVEQFYSDCGTECCGWVPSLGQSVAVIETFLIDHGLRKQTLAAMGLSAWPTLPVDPSVRVLPARAMRKAFRSLHQDDREADLAERRLDHAQFDVFVAMVDAEPAGRCGLLQVGEIADVRNLYVSPAFRRRQVATTLISHVLEMARRLMMKSVCGKIDVENTEGMALLRSCGFEQHGEVVEFWRA